jgi:pyruvate dehydrogenase E2 component (dihydrolipoamide acetyltransferase)
MSIVVRMPEILTGMAEAALVSWYIRPGERVELGQPLAEVETEKAVVDYESEVRGTLAGYLVEVGQPVAVGEPIAVVATEGESVEDALGGAGGAAAPAAAAPAAPAVTAVPEPVTTPAPTATTRRPVSPIVRRLARERGIDPQGIEGTGPGGRVTRRDLERASAADATAAVSPPAASIAPAASGAVDEAPSRMRATIARRLTLSKATVPHFYLEADCDVDRLLALRQEINASAPVRISVNDLVVKAVAAAFTDVPAANAIWLDDRIRRFSTVDVAVAVAIDEGLVTPVVRGVEDRSLSDLSATIADLAERARVGRLRQPEIEGGVLAVSNLGMYGIERFAAIINPPHAGILAIGRATPRPVVRDGALAIATVMSVTLSGDHRVLDGALAAQWLAAFVRRIEQPMSLLV